MTTENKGREDKKGRRKRRKHNNPKKVRRDGWKTRCAAGRGR